MSQRDDLRVGLCEVFKRSNPGLAQALRMAKANGLPRHQIEGTLNRIIDGAKAGQPPQTGEMTRSAALLYIEWLFDTEEPEPLVEEER